MRTGLYAPILALACAVILLTAGCGQDSAPPATGDRLVLEVRKPKLEMLELLESGAPGAAEALLVEARDAVRDGGAGDRLLMQRLQAFSSSDPELGRLLRDWMRRVPESALAHLALGLHLRHISFKLRGGDVIRHTNEYELTESRDFANQAAVHYKESARLDPGNPVVWAFLANLPAASRPAGLDWDTVLEQHAPFSESAWYMALFNAQPKWGGSIFRLQDLLQRLEARIATNPELAALRGFDQFAIADRHYWNGDHKAALTSCERAIKTGGLAKYREVCSFALRKLGRRDEALEMIDRAIADSPEDVNYLAERARVLEAMGRMEQAAVSMQQVLRYRPYDPGMLRQTAFYLEKVNRLDEAFALLERARVFGEFDDRLHDAFARVHYTAGQYSESAESARRALELSRNKSWPYARLANAYNKLFDCPNHDLSLKKFLQSCAALNDCTSKDMEWARNSLEVLKTTPTCQQWREQEFAGEASVD